MPANIEIKARVPDFAALCELAGSISSSPPEVLDQEDIFFVVPAERLKLRILSEKRGELILYQRANRAGPKKSEYSIAPTSEPHVLKAILEKVLITRAVVRKRRQVYHVGQTRVHLDQVEGLGDFMELEVVLRAGQSESEGVAIARDLMEKLGIAEDQLVDQAYVDLLAPER